MGQRPSSVLLVVVLLGAGLYAIAWRGVPIVLEAAEVAEWPTVTGVVTSSHSERGSGGSSVSHSWYVVVAYRFELDGELYHGDRWTVAGARKARGEAHADELRGRYFADDPIEVRYDPKDPTRSALAEGGALIGWAHIGFGFFLLAAGAYIGRMRRIG